MEAWMRNLWTRSGLPTELDRLIGAEIEFKFFKPKGGAGEDYRTNPISGKIVGVFFKEDGYTIHGESYGDQVMCLVIDSETDDTEVPHLLFSGEGWIWIETLYSDRRLGLDGRPHGYVGLCTIKKV